MDSHNSQWTSRRLFWPVLALPFLILTASPALAGSPAVSAAHWWTAVALNGRSVEELVYSSGLMYAESDGTWWALSASGAKKSTAPDCTRQMPCQTDVRVPGTAFYVAQPGSASPARASGATVSCLRNHAWVNCLLLLPAGGLSAPPAITGLSAFRKGSQALYLATYGYGVLTSPDDGTTWLSTSNGLPLDVNTVLADPRNQTVYAATSRGVFAHHLAPLPAPPNYPATALARNALLLTGLTVITGILAAAVTVILGKRQQKHGPAGHYS